MSPAALASLARRFAPLSLAETNAVASLQHRVDRKYVMRFDELVAAARLLTADFTILEIDRSRIFAYDTVYFDDPVLRCYRAHVQGRRNRFKVRMRRYGSGPTCFFELKRKDARGATVKSRLELPGEQYGAIGDQAVEFAVQTLHLDPDQFRTSFAPTLDIRYERMTLVERNCETRVTCDYHLGFRARSGDACTVLPGYVLVETKGGVRPSGADRVFMSLGRRPVSASKYCLGIGSTRDVVNNPSRRLLRTYFDRLPPAERSTP